MDKLNSKLTILAIFSIGYISIANAQLVPDLKTLGQLVRQNFEGYTTQNTRTYTLVGNGNANMFPLDRNAALPLPPNAAGPVRTVMTASPSGYPYSYQKSPAEVAGWQPSNVNPYSYMMGHQGRSDFSHEVEEKEGDIITVDDLQKHSDDGDVSREVEIQSTMTF